jgi:multidrug resistance efflux pump
MKFERRLGVLVGGAMAAASACALLTAQGSSRASTSAPVVGMVRQTEIRIAPETTGRLVALKVVPGQHVRKGDLLAIIDNPELAASLEESKAAAASTRADRERVYSGVRAEQVAIAAQSVRTAQANLLLAQQQNYRAVTLSSKSFLSRQKLDESIATLAQAQAQLDLARADYAAAEAGPTLEERALADAKVALSRSAVAAIQADLDKTRLTAPLDGTIGIQVAQPGEVMTPGKSVMTLEADGQRWFGFTVREDDLPGLSIGATVALATSDGRRIEARVSELRPLGEFATWRAARAVGDHDLNSFQMRLDPTAGSEGLEPGMTVWMVGRS